MIKQIHDSKLARDFLNSVPFDEYIPKNFPVCCDITIVLGWHDPDLVAMFPFQMYRDAIECHAAILRDYRGKKAVDAGKAAIKWIFENTEYDMIFSRSAHRHGEIYATQCGLKRVNGRLEVSKWAAL